MVIGVGVEGRRGAEDFLRMGNFESRSLVRAWRLRKGCYALMSIRGRRGRCCTFRHPTPLGILLLLLLVCFVFLISLVALMRLNFIVGDVMTLLRRTRIARGKNDDLGVACRVFVAGEAKVEVADPAAEHGVTRIETLAAGVLPSREKVVEKA